MMMMLCFFMSFHTHLLSPQTDFFGFLDFLVNLGTAAIATTHQLFGLINAIY
jgi:hypothetical protein